VELTGRQRCDALAARQMMNQNCIAASVARRWRRSVVHCHFVQALGHADKH
jgi:hypothetical protein